MKTPILAILTATGDVGCMCAAACADGGDWWKKGYEIFDFQTLDAPREIAAGSCVSVTLDDARTVRGIRMSTRRDY